MSVGSTRPVGELRGHQPGGDGAAQQRRGRDLVARVGVEPAELAVGPEPAQRPRRSRSRNSRHAAAVASSTTTSRTSVPMQSKVRSVMTSAWSAGRERAAAAAGAGAAGAGAAGGGAERAARRSRRAGARGRAPRAGRCSTIRVTITRRTSDLPRRRRRRPPPPAARPPRSPGPPRPASGTRAAPRSRGTARASRRSRATAPACVIFGRADRRPGRPPGLGDGRIAGRDVVAPGSPRPCVTRPRATGARPTGFAAVDGRSFGVGAVLGSAGEASPRGSVIVVVAAAVVAGVVATAAAVVVVGIVATDGPGYAGGGARRRGRANGGARAGRGGRGRRCGAPPSRPRRDAVVAADDVDRAADRLGADFRARGGGGGRRPRPGAAATAGRRPRWRRRRAPRGRRSRRDEGGAQAHAHTIGSGHPSARQAEGKLWQNLALRCRHPSRVRRAPLSGRRRSRSRAPARQRLIRGAQSSPPRPRPRPRPRPNCRRRRRSRTRCCRPSTVGTAVGSGVGLGRGVRVGSGVRVGVGVGEGETVSAGASRPPAVNGSEERPTLWPDRVDAAVVRPAATNRPATAADHDRRRAPPAGHVRPAAARGSFGVVPSAGGSRIVATAPPPERVRQRHRTAPARRELARDRQAQPRAASPRGTPDDAAVEAVEDGLLLARRQPRALVGDRQPAGPHDDRDDLARRAVVDRVLEHARRASGPGPPTCSAPATARRASSISAVG